MDNPTPLSPAQRAMLRTLVAAMPDPTQWVRCELLRDALPYLEYRAILGLPAAYVERLEEYATIGKVVAVRPTALGLALVREE